MRPVYFLSDFGLEDPYVAVVKAVLAERAPGPAVVDLAHALPPQDLRRAAYALFEALPYLPEGAVVLAVVDPGVGTARRAVAALGRWTYVGPDNGLFTLAWLLDPPRRAFLLEPPRPRPKAALPGWAPGEATFHGRDVFAPAAAHLALGLPRRGLGRRCRWRPWPVSPSPSRRGRKGRSSPLTASATPSPPSSGRRWAASWRWGKAGARAPHLRGGSGRGPGGLPGERGAFGGGGEPGERPGGLGA